MGNPESNPDKASAEEQFNVKVQLAELDPSEFEQFLFAEHGIDLTDASPKQYRDILDHWGEYVDQFRKWEVPR